MPLALCHLDFGFTRQSITRYSSLGTPYSKWIEVGMPKLPRKMLDTVFYLYKSRDAAEKGEAIGGTGFFIGMRSEIDPQVIYGYGVTNWHVAVKNGYSVIRINTSDGKPDIFEFGPEDWEFIPGGSDVAAIELPELTTNHNVVVVTDNFLIPETVAEELQLGPGDDVFMIGRFVDYESGPTNTPFVRFGNISSLPVPVRQPTGSEQESYCVDMHSRSGYSGSPVYFFRSSVNNLDFLMDGGQPIVLGKSDCALLGIHWGQFPEEWDVIRGKKARKSESSVEISGDTISGLSGITCVVPSWRIAELLNIDKWKKARREKDMKLKSKTKTLPVEESATTDNKGDDLLRNMLNTPPAPRTAKANKKADSH